MDLKLKLGTTAYSKLGKQIAERLNSSEAGDGLSFKYMDFDGVEQSNELVGARIYCESLAAVDFSLVSETEFYIFRAILKSFRVNVSGLCITADYSYQQSYAELKRMGEDVWVTIDFEAEIFDIEAADKANLLPVFLAVERLVHTCLKSIP